MNDNVRKVFDMLGVEPNEKFKIEGDGDILYHINRELYLFRDNGILCNCKLLSNLLNGCFTIIKLPKKKKLRDLTEEEWNKWKQKNCNNCDKCIFRYVSCYNSYENCSWLNNKNLYSDKFLDQEIEVEE